jgi:His/Glu/Gln/Arg/opine family amino acid ABC transporter permease subunit
MAVEAAERPPSGLTLIRNESVPMSLTALGLGALGLLVLFLGAIVVLASHGFTPADSLVRGLKAHELDAVMIVAMIVGVAAMAVGLVSLRAMATKVSREQCIAAAVLGAQALLLGAAAFWFVNGERVELFTTSYLDFERLGPMMGDFLNGAKNTLILAFSAEFFGIILGLTLAIFAISKRAVVRAPARAYINFFRGTPLIWQLIFIGVGIPIGLGIPVDAFRAGVLALSLNAGAYMAEVFRAGIQSIERGQIEAARGLGMSYLQAMRYAIVPQAVRRVIPPLMNEFVILVKDTALIIVLGLTSAQRDLMNVGDQAVANTFNATPFIMVALGYLAITLPLIRLVNALEKRLRSGLVGVGA